MAILPFFRRLTLDVVVWAAVPSLFLCVYVGTYAAPLDSVLPHLRLVMLALFGLTMVRIALSRLIPHRTGSTLAAAFIIAVVLLVTWLYYAFVLIGLQSWVQVISYQLIRSYAAQLPVMLETLGLSLPVVVIVVAVAFAVIVAAVWAYLRRFDWTADVAQRLSPLRFAGLLLFGGVVVGSEVFSFVIAPPANRGEPLAVTFHPQAMTRRIEGHVFDGFSAELIDRREDAERVAYKVDERASRKNLVMIVVDALRPDHLSVYGYERDTTPHLRALERSGALRKVRGARSSCSETACGLLSLASSKYVFQFSNRPFTLQQVLKRHGYRIHMILGGDHTNFYGLKEMYGDVDTYFDGSHAPSPLMNDDQIVVERAKSLSVSDGRPVMLQFHLMSTHVLGVRRESSNRYRPSVSYFLPQFRTAEGAANFYDNGVVQADAVIGELLAILRGKGYLENSLVVVTADHGEALGEHGTYVHGKSVYEEALQIPLMFASYGYHPRPFHEQRRAVGQVDIAPTILAELGMTVPKTWAGAPLHGSDDRGLAYFQERDDVGLVDYRDRGRVVKFWTSTRSQRHFAFDLVHDEREQSNIVDALPPPYLQELRFRLLRQRSVTAGAN